MKTVQFETDSKIPGLKELIIHSELELSLSLTASGSINIFNRLRICQKLLYWGCCVSNLNMQGGSFHHQKTKQTKNETASKKGTD